MTTVWPAPDGLWHVGVNAFEPHATTKPVTEQELGRLLEEWGVEVDRWVSWLDSHLWTMRNPFLWTSPGDPTTARAASLEAISLRRSLEATLRASGCGRPPRWRS